MCEDDYKRRGAAHWTVIWFKVAEDFSPGDYCDTKFILLCLRAPVRDACRLPKHRTGGAAEQYVKSSIILLNYRGQVCAPRLRDQDKHSHYKPVQLELNRVLWLQMKWPTQCVLNVPHFPLTAITPTSPGVNSETVRPIGYLVAMMWHSGHPFSLRTGNNLHLLNFH